MSLSDVTMSEPEDSGNLATNCIMPHTCLCDEDVSPGRQLVSTK